MFWKKKVQKNGISALEKRICDLENPFKFEIGEDVMIEWINIGQFIDGKIVDKRITYMNNHFKHTDTWITISHNIDDVFKNANYVRINEYFFYSEDLKMSDWRNEADLQLKPKKK